MSRTSETRPRPGSAKSARTTTADDCTGPPTCTAPISSASSASSGHGLVDRGLGRAVEHDAERALLRVLADEHDRAPEVGIDERRAGDERWPVAATPRPYHRRMEGVGREIRLVGAPPGLPGARISSRSRRSPIPDPADGQVLIRNAYFSVDPYMRAADERRALLRRTVHARRGDDRRRRRAGRRLAEPAATPKATGSLHQLGWREWALSDGRGLRRLDPAVAPVSTALGVLGMPGLHRLVRALRDRPSRRRARPSSSRARPARSAARSGRWRASPAAA